MRPRFLYVSTIFSVFGLLFAEAQEQRLTGESLPPDWQTYIEGPSAQDWWKSVGDSVLDTLISRGLAHNYDVLAAGRRLEIARLGIAQARAAYYPTLGITAGWTAAKTAGAMSGKDVPSVDSRRFALGTDLSWEIDLFGKIRSQVNKSKADWRITCAETAGMELSVTAEIAAEYFQLRVYQAQLAILRQHIASQASILKIAEARHEAGLNAGIDVAQAKTVYYSTLATLPQLETSIVTTGNSLAVLVGDIPTSLTALKADTATIKLPEAALMPALYAPADLIRRRPDIVEAEAVIAADAAALGIAKEEYLPSLTLEGSIGTYSRAFDGLFGKHSLGWEIAPQLSWTIFDGFGRKAAVAEAREQIQADIDAYNLTLLQAVSEVDNALAQYKSAKEQIEIYGKVVEEARRELELSLDLYKSGLAGFTNVATAQIDYLTYAETLIDTHGQALSAMVTLYKALGGGYTQP